MSGNREYRSDVFSLLFRDKKRALELYNALNGSRYDDPEQIENVELGNGGISLSVRNDVSFILDAHLNIYEHQSTICPNMPLRCLIYFTTMIHDSFWDKNIYGKTLVKIPTPHFVVFYNGTDDAPAQYKLRLSNAFENGTKEPELELICQVYNINKDKNPKLLEQSPSLRDYMYLIDLVRAFDLQTEYTDLGRAIKLAVEQCIRENVLKDFLQEHYTEVMKMMQWDFTFEHWLELEREEGRKEGADGERATAIRYMVELGLPKEKILSKYSREEYEQALL